MKDFTGSLDQAQRFLDQYEPIMAAYVLRDLEITKQAGLDRLMWVANKYGCVHNDIQPVVDQLRALNAQNLENHDPSQPA
jgi:hypothetical protein